MQTQIIAQRLQDATHDQHFVAYCRAFPFVGLRAILNSHRGIDIATNTSHLLSALVINQIVTEWVGLQDVVFCHTKDIYIIIPRFYCHTQDVCIIFLNCNHTQDLLSHSRCMYYLLKLQLFWCSCTQHQKWLPNYVRYIRLQEDFKVHFGLDKAFNDAQSESFVLQLFAIPYCLGWMNWEV